MPIDPRIPLGGQPVQPVDFWRVMAGAQQLAAQSQELRAQQRKEADDQAMRQALQEFGSDYDSAVKALAKRGHGQASLLLGKLIEEQRDQVSQRIERDLKNNEAALALGARVAEGIYDESSYKLAQPMIAQLSPEVARALGDQYDPARLEQLKIAGLKATERNSARQQAWQEWKDARNFAAETPERIAKETASLAGWMQTADTPEEWAMFRRTAQELGFTPGVVGLFPEQFSPEALARAQELAGTAEGAKSPHSDYGRFETDYLEAAAQRMGKTGANLTPAERVKLKTEARKQFGQADDAARRPLAPIVIQTGAGPQLVDRGSGTARPITDASGQAIGQAPTAEMRNRQARMATVKKSIDAVRALGERIITKVGPAQRVDAIKRGAEAVFGSDPEFRTYQDARRALAGNLAVAQQGSRPSDADINAIWLPMVPDAYRDTAESARMKWQLIEQSSLPPEQVGADEAPPARKVDYRFKNGKLEKVP